MTDSFEIGRGNTAIAERSRTLTELLVGWPSETGSVGEAEFAERLAGL